MAGSIRTLIRLVEDSVSLEPECLGPPAYDIYIIIICFCGCSPARACWRWCGGASFARTTSYGSEHTQREREIVVILSYSAQDRVPYQTCVHSMMAGLAERLELLKLS